MWPGVEWMSMWGVGVTKAEFAGRSESPIRRSPKSHHSTPSDLNSPRVCCSSLMPRARARLVHSRLGSPTVWSTFSQAASAEQEKGSNLYKTNRGKYIVSAWTCHECALWCLNLQNTLNWFHNLAWTCIYGSNLVFIRPWRWRGTPGCKRQGMRPVFFCRKPSRILFSYKRPSKRNW